MDLVALYKFVNNLDLTIRIRSHLVSSFYTDKEYGKSLKIIQIDIGVKEFFLYPSQCRAYMFRQITHELGHYLIAPPGRRHREDYGIPKENKRNSSTHSKWDLDEVKAQIVENHLSGKFGGKYLKYPISKNKLQLSLRPHISVANRWWKEIGRDKIDRILKEHNVK